MVRDREKGGSWINIAGFAAIIVKLLPKFVKLAKVAKVGWAAASFNPYALIFNWKFALVIITMLFVHESGHIWAMKRCGMRTKGIYFIPFIGAAAVMDDQFPSRRAEVFVALMGPIWGLAYALAAFALFGAFQNPMFAAVASWTAFVTLFNLFPFNPLDGGRVVKSITWSISGRVGLIAMVAGMALAVVLMIASHIWLLALVIAIGIVEMIAERAAETIFGKRSRDKHRAFREKSEKEIHALKEELLEPFLSLARERQLNNRISRLKYQINRSLEKEYNEEEERKKRSALTPMTKPEIIKSAAGILVVAGVSLLIMFAVEHVPGSDLAMEVLRD